MSELGRSELVEKSALSKKVGRIHNKDDPIDKVIAKEMARIHQAFDKKLVENQEELVTKF